MESHNKITRRNAPPAPPCKKKKDQGKALRRKSWQELEQIMLNACRVNMTISYYDIRTKTITRNKLVLAVDDNDQDQPHTFREAITALKINMALQGNEAMIKDLQDRAKVKPNNPIQLTIDNKQTSTSLLNVDVSKVAPEQLQAVRQLLRAGIKNAAQKIE